MIVSYTGVNQGNIRTENRSAVLKLLNDRGAMSRKDIALALGLTPATVTLICAELLAAGVLCEKGEAAEAKRVGRKKVLIDINFQYRWVLAINIEITDTTISICDLKGEVAAGKTMKTDRKADPETFLKQVADESKVLMWENGTSKESILGVGVSVPGSVDREPGISRHAYRIWQEPVPVKEILSRYLDYPMIVENNVKAFAEGELVYGSGVRRENLFFVKWGPGVGSAIVTHGQVYNGQDSNGAELGHVIVEKNGIPCRCGRCGCLETRVSTHAIADQVRAACTPEAMPVLYRSTEGDVSRITARTLAQWYDREDPGMWAVMDGAVDLMARTVINAITLLSPEQVILYGYMFDLPGVQERFRELCAQYDGSYPQNYIQKSGLSGKLDYIGPLALVMNELFLWHGISEDLP